MKLYCQENKTSIKINEDINEVNEDKQLDEKAKFLPFLLVSLLFFQVLRKLRYIEVRQMTELAQRMTWTKTKKRKKKVSLKYVNLSHYKKM